MDDREVSSIASRLASDNWTRFLKLILALSESPRLFDRVAGSRLLATAPRREAKRRRAVIEIAETLLRSDVPVVVANALFAMYCQGPVANVSRSVLRLSTSSDKFIARNTALLLGSSTDDSPAVKRALRRLAEYEEPSVRYWAVDALATRAKSDRKTIALLRRRTEDSERDIRGKALYGLAIADHPCATALITKELRRSLFDDAVVSAAEVLKAQELLPELERALRRRRVRDLMGDEIDRAIHSIRNGQ